MKIAYFDCFSGISGDMILGALLDAGLERGQLQAELDKLDRPALDLTATRVDKHAIAATHAHVRLDRQPITPEQEHHLKFIPPADQSKPGTHQHSHTHQQGHTHGHQHSHQHGHHQLEDITALIGGSRLDEAVKERALEVFGRLAAAEAQVHGLPPDQVHLHEVGALDAVADIVGAIAGLHLLGVEAVYASPLRLGTGTVQCAHGTYPVPVPGVLALCDGIPTEQTQIRAELVTPTGAALITTLAQSFGPAPPMRQERVGYGAGRRDLEEIPNLLRLRIGTTEATLSNDQAVVVEANIDDMNPELYGYLFDRLLGAGALDVYTTPVQMKKGRPGTLLSILAEEGKVGPLRDIVFAETTTIGLRQYRVERCKLQRRIDRVDTPYGSIRVKTTVFDGTPRNAPEYDDCARQAHQHQVPIQAVYDAARAACQKD
ncbi:MAG: nickel pincer cofactor biosynthesis protein LarC [Candidatus Latescibacteria bacterium]|nr:nickel pincer cofactor biosynthesis protein LarC [Candidatus Latescibacterota bacterium]